MEVLLNVQYLYFLCSFLSEETQTSSAGQSYRGRRGNASLHLNGVRETIGSKRYNYKIKGVLFYKSEEDAWAPMRETTLKCLRYLSSQQHLPRNYHVVSLKMSLTMTSSH